MFGVSAPAQYGAVGGKIEVRLDSETGPLVGETEALQPQTVQNAPPIQARAPLKATTGLHDVYFVFRNDQAKGQQMLFIVLTATFVNGTSTPASAPASTPATTGGR